MDSALTAAAFLLLITVGPHLVHRLNAQHAGKTAAHAHRRSSLVHRSRRRHSGAPKQAG